MVGRGKHTKNLFNHLLPYLCSKFTTMVIHSADFVKSSPRADLCPDPSLPEYAFIGRSNVGKSSLINMLVNRKDLAKTSSTPGKTQLINHFVVNENWYLVDLPGYGYAKVSKDTRRKFSLLINYYIKNRPNLVCVFVLVDSRHSPQQSDLDFIKDLGEWEIPFSIVFTKGDKLNARELNLNIQAYKKKLLTWWEQLPDIFITSSEKGRGRDEILQYIDDLNREVAEPIKEQFRASKKEDDLTSFG